MAKTKKTLHISLRNALLAIINNISVFAKLWTIFTEILEHQYFETITLHRSVTRQAWINVFLTIQLASADHPLYLDIQTFFFLLVFLFNTQGWIWSPKTKKSMTFYIQNGISLQLSLFFEWSYVTLEEKGYFFIIFFVLLALVCVC